MAPLKIVSLLPSITEIVSSVIMGSDEACLVGCTHCCDFPADIVEKLPRVTRSIVDPAVMGQEDIHKVVQGALKQGHSIYHLDQPLLEELQPDIVFTQALCDVCAVSYPVVIDSCAKLLAKDPDLRVISLEPTTLGEVLDAVRTVGRECKCEQRARSVADHLQVGLDQISAVIPHGVDRPRVAFLEWTAPLFAGGHWIPEMVERAGGTYSLCEKGRPSIQITPQTLIDSRPQYIFIGLCGYDEKKAKHDALRLWDHDWWLDLPAVKENHVYALDANSYYARPGPRLVNGTALLAYILHGVKSQPYPGSGWSQIIPPVAASA
mmetsp:Transcript_14095/g.23030  ORF Transcript_14095/g.23030 Transcript_14095/m.23030 type:complete len:321 (+) Transcript_14095:181-1143(+)|eukprot:CAMPEP_0203761440 /NCGR_PEP_ID=MMETSP0098-20131031/14532_1 /ASSEMBLY_ACC=CAM_ASM_000208 /TAXON_ID=96639 /ORGANISM=" , Strain NY0313808BC1" /LENGTH=320 /DNA_ID=CAMNT_0050655439 /DNA_START=108 /DNA_END=1070 /DNA_ORIENTATION=-